MIPNPWIKTLMIWHCILIFDSYWCCCCFVTMACTMWRHLSNIGINCVCIDRQLNHASIISKLTLDINTYLQIFVFLHKQVSYFCISLHLHATMQYATYIFSILNPYIELPIRLLVIYVKFVIKINWQFLLLILYSEVL